MVENTMRGLRIQYPDTMLVEYPIERSEPAFDSVQALTNPASIDRRYDAS